MRTRLVLKREEIGGGRSELLNQGLHRGALLEDKGGRCVGLTTLPPSCADCLEIGNLNLLEPSGPVQACYGIALLCSSLVYLGAFPKLQKTSISFVMSVRPSVLMELLGSHWKNFNEIRYLRISRKYFENIQVSLKSDKNNGYFMWGPINILLSYLCHLFLE